MNEEQVEIKWTDDESIDFIKYGNFFVPYREEQNQIIADLLPAEKAPTVVEICCGEGILSKHILESIPGAQIIAADGSDEMLKKTKENLAPFEGNYELAKIDLFSRNWRVFNEPIHGFVSSLAIHHLDGPQKKELFSDLYRQLEDGGALIIADLIKHENDHGKNVSAKLWDKAVMERSLRYRGSLEGYEAFERLKWNCFSDPNFINDPIDRPSTLREQLGWLEEAGFKEVDVFWMNAGHVIFGGYK
ncbi:trans-aconitate 2-methyltransferase [Aquimarina sp. RZ0]|uniref:class I SAM-dependent methyltransferase n=1 Tax=Aquimarina sp. RZ0 TaxID=2607730 RepID=UPI0011F293DC|nr:class I SAM-dependent methyltransferase [Aquimarina sp. RZ0]KAA1243800.1 class I SAM-dependent methyltransferase [Aquimarina sp. RZ0]